MNNVKLFLSFLIFAFAISSCDYVEFPYPEETAQPADCDTTDFPPNTNTERNVLVEDFTGHKCPNCPFGAAYLRGLQNTLESQGKHLIIVSLHATSPLSDPENNPDGSYASDYRTVEGNALKDFYNITYIPVALIDRVEYGASEVVEVGDWETAINDRFDDPIGANLQMSVNYDAAFDKACVWIETEILENTSDNINLVVAIVEDSIVDWQYNGSPGDPDYPQGDNENFVHRHVFRGNANGTWGTQIATGGVTAGDKIVIGYNIDINPGWNPEQISFVVYVYNETTKEILQAIEKHL